MSGLAASQVDMHTYLFFYGLVENVFSCCHGNLLTTCMTEGMYPLPLLHYIRCVYVLYFYNMIYLTSTSFAIGE